MGKMIYLDNAATTKTAPEVVQAMLPYFSEYYGNPSSIYDFAGKSKEAITKGREQIAEVLGAKKEEIYFTAGGSESDNWALKATFEAYKAKGNHIITTKIEHHAILHTCEYLEKRGAKITYVDVDENGIVKLDELEKAITPETILISVMFANNEIGSIQPIKEIGRIAKEHGVLFHTDAVQAFCQVPINVDECNIDMLSSSGHKINGPKGIGFLYIRKGVKIRSFVHGGAQERKRRAGTENVPGIVGYGVAAARANASMKERTDKEIAIRDHLIHRIETEIPYVKVNGCLLYTSLTSEQAKEELLRSVEDDVKVDVARLYRELESRAKEEAGKKAKEYVVNAIQKCAVDHVAETTISVVQLPSDEMKGRIIGREGRNIRTLETLTGVDLIIDDTPEAVVLSAFDPIRREVARVALEKLIVDGRIHPARIEEMVEKAQREVEAQIREDGENAAMDVGVHGIHPELLKLLGRMKFRSSYGQNALRHSIEVAQLSGMLAGEVGVDVRMAKRAGLLHDIGKSIDHEVEGSHIQIGVDLCKKYKESQIVINTVASHHGDCEPESLIACIVQAADAISAARPGARRETLETYTNRLKQLEDITNQFKGVDKSFAIQAGREIRVMVVPEHVNDADMVLLARDIAKQIEAELEYPGQIKVNVIRESRAIDYAK